MVLKTVGNVVGHTGQVRKHWFILGPVPTEHGREDLRPSMVVKTFGNVVGHTGQVRKHWFVLGPVQPPDVR